MKCEENEGAARPVSHTESRLQQLSQKEESRDEAGWIPQAPDTAVASHSPDWSVSPSVSALPQSET